MKIAIPLVKGILASHFGHCETFALIDADPAAKKILSRTEVTPPAHEPGVFPVWLAEQGATHILAGGMGLRAQELFTQNNIQVVIGAPSDTTENIVGLFLDGTLQTGANPCDH